MTIKQKGLVAAISLGGKIQHAFSGTKPLEVLEPILERVAVERRGELRKKLAPALELRPEEGPDPMGFYFQDFVPLEGSDLVGWMIVMPCEVVS